MHAIAQAPIAGIPTRETSSAGGQKKPLNILILEDVRADAELMEIALQNGGLRISAKRVDSEEEYLSELRLRAPDVILSDHGFPDFDGLTALELARRHAPDIPFIFVTGALGEEVAIRAFELGATDYILKHRIEALPPAILRALAQVRDRKRRKTEEEQWKRIVLELLDSLRRVRPAEGMIPVCCSCRRIRDNQGQWETLEEYLLVHLGAKSSHGLCPQCAIKLYPDSAETILDAKENVPSD